MDACEIRKKQEQYCVIRLADGLVFGWTPYRDKDRRNFRVVLKSALETVKATEVIAAKGDAEIKETISFKYDGSPQQPVNLVEAPVPAEDPVQLVEAVTSDVEKILAKFTRKAEIAQYAKDQFGVTFPETWSRAEMESKILAYFSGEAIPAEG